MLPARLAVLWILKENNDRMWTSDIYEKASNEFGRFGAIPKGTVNYLKTNGFIRHHPQYRGDQPMGTYTISEKGCRELHRALNRSIKSSLILSV